MTKHNDLWVCEDCYMVFHYGLAQFEPSEGWDTDAVTRFYDEHGFQNLFDNCADESGHIEFSKAPCDMCKSHLAGGRSRLGLIEEEFVWDIDRQRHPVKSRTVFIYNCSAGHQKTFRLLFAFQRAERWLAKHTKCSPK